MKNTHQYHELLFADQNKVNWLSNNNVLLSNTNNLASNQHPKILSITISHESITFFAKQRESKAKHQGLQLPSYVYK